MKDEQVENAYRIIALLAGAMKKVQAFEETEKANPDSIVLWTPIVDDGVRLAMKAAHRWLEHYGAERTDPTPHSDLDTLDMERDTWGGSPGPIARAAMREEGFWA